MGTPGQKEKDNAKFEKVILLNRDMTMVETDLKVDAAENLVKERWRQEYQVKKHTTKTLTKEEICRMKRLDYDSVRGKALIMFLEEEVEIDAWRREDGEV